MQRESTLRLGEHKPAALMLLLVMVATTLVHYRTYAITGYPLMGTAGMTDLFRQMGFRPQFPDILLMDTARIPLPPLHDLLGRYVFWPSRLNMATWTGNLWASVLAIALLAALLQRNPRAIGRAWLLLVMGAALFLLLASFHFPSPGGDGHFFLVPIAALLLASMAILAEVCKGQWRALPWVLLLVSLVQFTAFFMSASWYTGTRKLDVDFAINPLDQTRRTRELLGYVRLLPIADAIASCGHGERVIGLVPHPTAFLLPGRYESLKELSWANPKLVNTPAAFANYLQRARIELVVVPTEAAMKADASSKAFGPAFATYPELMRDGIRKFAATGQPVTMARLGDYELYHVLTGHGAGACATH